jgi:uracil phosphoribosyltransferase
MLSVEIIDHPLVQHKLTLLRDQRTPTATFRSLVEELVTLLAYESTKDIEVSDKPIQTPVAEAVGVKLGSPEPLMVPIIRAGLGMLSGMLKILPSADVGFLGMMRDEETLKSVIYANRMPKSLEGRRCFILDPMLATGGTIAAAANYLARRGAKNLTAICLLVVPEGIKYVEEAIGPDVNLRIVSPAMDQGLNERGFIVPGLGDAGDRLYGPVE